MKEDLICVKEGRKYGYLDPTGLIVIEPRFALAFPGRFDEARDFTGGVALVCSDSRMFLIDQTGREIPIRRGGDGRTEKESA